VTVTEQPQAIVVTARQAVAQPGHGSCVMPITGSVHQLHGNVGSRTIRPADGASGDAFDLSTRLHQPITGGTGLPFGAQVTHAPAGDQWTLAYGQQGPAISYALTSTPDDHRHTALATTVRGQPRVTPCTATLCWREHGMLYSIGPAGGFTNPDFTPTDAARLAATLT
jgi:hypothetical protein